LLKIFTLIAIITAMPLSGIVLCMGNNKDAYKILVGTNEKKTPLGKFRRRKDNIKEELRFLTYI
jgi:hypothetical protein